MGRVLNLSVADGTELIFRIVRRGDNYGKSSQFVWDSSDFLIEVHDSKRNHMIGSYFQSVLLQVKGGLCLQKDTYELTDIELDHVKSWLQTPDVGSTPIGYHYHFLSDKMIINGTIKPNMIRVISKDQALEQAKKDYLENQDATFGCLTVFSDGSISQEMFTQSDLEF
jgi:hypothetical protein